MASYAFPEKALMAELTAKMLLEIKAVNFRAEDPYKLTSGLASPVYIDCRKLISYPRIRSTLMDFAASVILRDVGFESVECNKSIIYSRTYITDSGIGSGIFLPSGVYLCTHERHDCHGPVCTGCDGFSAFRRNPP